MTLPFFGPDGRAVIVAIDHGMGSGHVAGLERPEELLRALAGAAIDGFILNPGMGRIAARIAGRGTGQTAESTTEHGGGRTLESGAGRAAASASERTAGDVGAPTGGPPWLLAADAYGRSTLPGEDGPTDLHTMLWTAADARSFGAAGLKVLLVFGREDAAAFQENLRGVARLVSDGRAHGVPVMVETTLWGDAVDRHRENDGRMVLDTARVGFELGADVLKIPVPDDLGCLTELASGVDVPIVLMGGPAGDGEAVLAGVANAMRAGAHGVAIGRNAWTRRAPAAFACALARVVHEGASPASAWRGYLQEESDRLAGRATASEA